jgi:hypothetical protein
MGHGAASPGPEVGHTAAMMAIVICVLVVERTAEADQRNLHPM